MSLDLCIPIAGTLHILHNAGEALADCLSHYSTWLGQLKTVIKVLTEPWKRRLVQTCAHRQQDAAVLRQCSAKVHEKRWGTVVHATYQVLQVEEVLRRVWDVSRYTFGNAAREESGATGGDEQSNGDFRLQVQQLDSTISSPLFWAYAKGMNLLGLVLHRLEVWCEGCSCHMPKKDLHLLGLVVRRYQGRAPGSTSTMASKCPLRARRAAEMSVGDFQSLCLTFLNMASQQLLPECAALSRKEKDIVFTDFDRGRAHLVCVLQIKTANWMQLPLALACVGHHDPHAAREGFAALHRSLREHPSGRPQISASSFELESAGSIFTCSGGMQ